MIGECADGAGQRGEKLAENIASVIQNTQVGKIKGEGIRDRRRVGRMGDILEGQTDISKALVALPHLWGGTY